MSECRAKILIVDDEPAIRHILERALRQAGHDELHQADCVGSARRLIASSGPFDLVLLDVRMPGGSGLELLAELAPLAPGTVVIMATALADIETAVQALQQGAYDYLVKPFSPAAVQLAVARALRRRRLELEAAERRREVEQLVVSRTRALEATRHALLMGLCQMAEFRHSETGAHLRRIPQYCRVLALEMARSSPYQHQITEEFLAALIESAPLHDIGKVGVADAILLKPDKLTAPEFEQVKLHTVYGRDICRSVRNILSAEDSAFIDMALDITYCHHERWDGSGYPQGLAGARVPLASRLVHLADFYDACRSPRVYRPEPIPRDAVIRAICQGAGTAFDPTVVQAFERSLEQIVALEEGEG